MNWGYWFSSPKKIALTLLNTLALCVGIIVVSLVPDFLRRLLPFFHLNAPNSNNSYSVAWDFTLLENLFTINLLVRPFHAPITRDVFPSRLLV